MQRETLFPVDDGRQPVRNLDRLLPEDVGRELQAPPQWVEEARWRLPHHVHVLTSDWFVHSDDLDVWRDAWKRDLTRSGGVEAAA
jgi:hypothetical protein